MEDIVETNTSDAVLPPEETGFIVVECKIAINQNNNRVCVPKAWITCKIGPGKKVAFGYPAGDEESIAMRIKNKEPADNSWETYIGEKIIESESYEDAVGYLQTICGGGNEQIEDTSNPIEPTTEPKNPLKLRIVIPKLDLKSQKKKKSEKKHHKKHLKEHSKDKVHKSKHRYMERLSLTGNISERSSPNSADTQVGTDSCVSWQSNCQSSPKSLESEISNSVQSAPETYLKNNNINSYSSKRTLLESLDAEIENNDGMLSEDRQLVENMYINIIRHVQYMKTMALAMKKYHLIAMEHKEILIKIAAKYKIPLPPVRDPVEKENERNGDLLEESLQDDEIETQDDDGTKNKQKKNPFDEKTLQDDEMKTQDDDKMENEKENDNTSEENLLGEKKNAEILLYTDDKSTEDCLSSTLEVATNKRKNINKDYDIQTLKHPGPGKGLIQMGQNPRFYISAKGLEKAQRTCKNVKEFARQLYREGFTRKALGTCSMTGLNRPALPYEARTILKYYAMKYGQDVGWESIEPKELEKNLRRFLCNNRRTTMYTKEGKKTRRWKPQKTKRA